MKDMRNLGNRNSSLAITFDNMKRVLLVIGVLLLSACSAPALTSVAPIESVFDYFDSQVQDRLRAIPIIECRSVDTALAQTVDYVPFEDVKILVSSDWNNRYRESKLWKEVYRKRGERGDEFIFLGDFKVRLLVHEYLHILQAENDIDIEQFYVDVQEWYNDPASGSPVYDDKDCNYIKYVLWYNLYSGNLRYKESEKEEEAFAHIGVELAEGKLDRYEVSETILDYYRGILRLDKLVVWSLKYKIAP